MEKSTEKLLKDFLDLIDSLKDKEKCDGDNFKKLWCDKYSMVQNAIINLPKSERDLFDSSYKRFFHERYGDYIKKLSKD